MVLEDLILSSKYKTLIFLYFFTAFFDFDILCLSEKKGFFLKGFFFVTIQ